MVRVWLSAIREKAELSHEEVAIKSGISRQYYGMIENGDRNPSVEVAKKIAEVLKFSWTLFFDHLGNKTLQTSEKEVV